MDSPPAIRTKSSVKSDEKSPTPTESAPNVNGSKDGGSENDENIVERGKSPEAVDKSEKVRQSRKRKLSESKVEDIVPENENKENDKEAESKSQEKGKFIRF